MKTSNPIKHLKLLALLFVALSIVSCNNDDDVPEEEDELEVITDVTLVFTDESDSNNVIRARAQDPDGAGAQELQVLDAINLSIDSQYILTFEISNALDPNDVEDIGAEILEKDNEHQFFFSFSDSAFDSPIGDGNIDTASDPISYNDMDENGNRVGLNTTWATSTIATSGREFRVVLKHQPDIKTATTGSNDGETDFDLTFILNIQ